MDNKIYKEQSEKNFKCTQQKTGLKRNPIDKYYTKLNIVKECIKLIKKYITILNNDLSVYSFSEINL